MRLHPPCLALGLLPAWICSSVFHLVVFPVSYSTECSVPLQWPGPPPAPPTVPGQFKRCEYTANSGILMQSLNSEIQLFSHHKHTAVPLASASELSFQCSLKSPRGFASRHDKHTLWCSPYRAARYGKPTPVSSSYITR